PLLPAGDLARHRRPRRCGPGPSRGHTCARLDPRHAAATLVAPGATRTRSPRDRRSAWRRRSGADLGRCVRWRSGRGAVGARRRRAVRAGGRRGADQGTRRVPAYAYPASGPRSGQPLAASAAARAGRRRAPVIWGRLSPGGASACLSLRPGQRAGLWRQGCRVSPAVGPRGERSLAFEDAAAWYAQAAELLDGPESECEDLRFAAARSHVRAGDTAGARNLYLRLSDSRDPGVRLRAAVGYEDAAFRPGLPGADACALLSRALDDMPADPDDPAYVRALASLGRAMAFTGDSRARRVGEQALEYARRLGDKRLLTHALLTMMWQPVAPGSTDHWLALAAELAPLARESEDWEALGIAANFCAVIAYAHADPDAWSDAVADLDRAARGSGQPLLAYLRGCNDYAHAFLHGDFAEAERIAEALLEIGRSFGPDATEGPYGLQMYIVRRETGALEAVRPLIDVVRQAQATWEPGLLALYTELGLTGQARSLLRRLLESSDLSQARQSWWGQWTAVLVFLVEAAVALRDADAARRLRPLLAPFTG